MYHHSTSLGLAQAHEAELMRQAHHARLGRELSAVPAHSKQQLVAVLVAALVVLGAMALI